VTQEPKITFPCDYPIKVIGDGIDGLSDLVLNIASRYDDTLTADKLSERESRQGNYRSITIRFRATGEDQLASLFSALKKHDAVRMVL
tara:strand:+ start:9602 stop:9865 length:264 start_codon:yes stop_codon:yes gene_type:complete